MSEGVVLEPSRLIAGALIGLVILLLLIIKFKVQAMVAILGIYAIGWQQVIKRMPLTTAYANKAVTLVWGLVWGLLLFHEQLNY